MSPATTPGSSSGNPPMASSYNTQSTYDRLAADEAAAAMRQRQAVNGRFLGYLNPTPMDQQAQTQGQTIQTGQFIPPALYTNPELTVNSSISSQPVPVISSGAGDASGAVASGAAFVLPGGADLFASTAGTTAVSGTTAAATISGTIPGTTIPAATGATTSAVAAPVTANTSLITPATAATTATPGTFAGTNLGALNPTMSSGATASPIAATGTVLNSINARGTAITTTPSTTNTAASTANLNPSMASASGGITTPLTAARTATTTTPATPTVTVTPGTGTTAALTLTNTNTTNTTAAATQAAGGRLVIPASTRGAAPIVVTSSTNGQLVISNVSAGRVRAVRP